MLPCLLLNGVQADGSYSLVPSIERWVQPDTRLMAATASLRRSHFRVSLVLLPALWDRRNCLAEKQSAVDTSLDLGMLVTGIKVSKSHHNYTTKH